MLYFAYLEVYSLNSMMKLIVIILLSLNLYSNSSTLDFLNKDSYNSMKDTFYPVSMPSQKWNQVVLNYSDNKVDLFINGQLERTFRLSGENASTKDTTIQSFIPQYSDLDTITIGDEFGVDGAVCNVEYYKRPLTSEQIAFQYNIFANSNPPVPREKKEQNSAQ